MRPGVVCMTGLVPVSSMPAVGGVACVLVLNGAQLRHLARRAAEHGRGQAAPQGQQDRQQQQNREAQQLHFAKGIS